MAAVSYTGIKCICILLVRFCDLKQVDNDIFIMRQVLLKRRRCQTHSAGRAISVVTAVSASSENVGATE